MNARIEIPYSFPVPGDIAGKRMLLTGAGLGELRAHAISRAALRSWGRPTDLAGAYQFLASDAAAFVTHVVPNVDGGNPLV